MAVDFKLYEALLWEPGEGYFLLEYHLRRLAASAEHFGFVHDGEAVRERLERHAAGLDARGKVRLMLQQGGELELETVEVKPSTLVRAALSSAPVDSSNPFLRHKTSHREVYERALAAHPEAEDVLLWNERGELTETCIGNLVLELEGHQVTPPLSSGLLAGTYRQFLIDRGELKEDLLTREDLGRATRMQMINSVRKRCPLSLL